MMKRVLCSSILLFAGLCVQAKEWDMKPQYEIVSDRLDTSLSVKQAVCEIQFYRQDTIIREPIRMSYNGTQQPAYPDFQGVARVPLKPGKYRFQFLYSNRYFEIVTDSVEFAPRHRKRLRINFVLSEIQVITFKPVIYVYPEKTQEVAIKLDVKGKLDFTYPAYNSGWKFTADPDGTIHMNGKQYDYLFWDGQTKVNRADPKLHEGFVVNKDSLIPFFENKLAAMGLTPREAADFITFWCPLMAANEQNFVHFEFNSGYDQFAEIAITPKPDNLFRMFMVWSAYDEANGFTVREQKIESVKRNGFTVIEWGGAEAKGLTNPINR